MSSDDMFDDDEMDVCEYNLGFTQGFPSQNIRYPGDEYSKLVQLLLKLSKTDINLLMEEIIRNDKIKDGSCVLLHIFQQSFDKNGHLHNPTVDDEDNVKFISEIIAKLRNAGKFNNISFAKLLFRNYKHLPLPLIWWLYKEEIVYLEPYWDICQPQDITHELLKIIEANDQVWLFKKGNILEDILTELLSGCYGPRTGICRLHKSKLWSSFCSNTLNDLIETHLTHLLEEQSQNSFSFLPLVTTSSYLPYNFKKRFCLSIIQKFITLKANEFDMNSAYLYQHLWTTRLMSQSLFIILEEIFSRFCDFNDVISIFERNSGNINWKFYLNTTAACMKWSKISEKQLCEKVQQHLLNMLKGGKISDFKIAILLIRQATMEDNTGLNYEIWFSSTFGMNSTFKTTDNQSMFKFFMSCLINVSSLEPAPFLKIHVQKSIRAPPMCNSLTLDYKNICRGRLQELKSYPTILLKGAEVNVLQILENTGRLKEVDAILCQIIKEDCHSYYEKIVPYLKREQPLFVKVKDILLSKKLVTIDILNHCKPPDKIIIVDDEDDYI